ncbi:MAG: hypothetical protein AB1696_21510 [Planctomycetota bacterium]
MMAEVQTTEGIVGFFDILGYENLLENNEPEDVLKNVISAIEQVPSETIRNISGGLNSPRFGNSRAVINELDWLAFSDTILLTMPYESDDDTGKALKWVVFLLASEKLMQLMWIKGLPLRGAVDIGRFVVKGNFFAGRPIVEAYRMSHSLDLAAAVLTKRAEDEFRGLLLQDDYRQIHDQLRLIVVDYLVPRKREKPEKLTTLNFFSVIGGGHYLPTGDPRQFVCRTFWKNNKDIPREAQSKVDNTEQYVRFLIERFRDVFGISDSSHGSKQGNVGK